MMPKAVLLFLAFVFLIACSSRQPVQEAAVAGKADTAVKQPAEDSFKRNTIIEQIACANDASQSYALYIPATRNKTAMPVVYFFDPHGNGALPLRHYVALADAFHFILIGSNNAKNGNDWNTTQTIVNTLFRDTKNRLLFDANRIYTCGFSGGAKVAGYAALHESGVTGVVAAGAGLPEGESISNFPFCFTGMAGNGDMNMTDLIALNSELDKTQTRHRLILFTGKHAWPPADVMRTAFTGWQLDAMRDKKIDRNDSLINAYAKESKQKIDGNIGVHQWVKAGQTCTLCINMLNGLTDETNWFVNKENLIRNNPVYRQQAEAAQQLFSVEQSKKQTFQQQFQQGDAQYWATTIRDLQTKARAQTEEGAMNQRLLAYLSLAFYSISNQLIGSNQNEAAQYFVTLYKMADATNSEAWYFSALLNARSNHSKEAENDLLKAAGYGFTDTIRMRQQTEFKTLSPQINFTYVESKMKKTEE